MNLRQLPDQKTRRQPHNRFVQLKGEIADFFGRIGLRFSLMDAEGVDRVIFRAIEDKRIIPRIVDLMGTNSAVVSIHAHTALSRMLRSSDHALREQTLLALNIGLMGKRKRVVSTSADLIGVAIRNPNTREAAMNMTALAIVTGTDTAKLQLLLELKTICRTIELPQETRELLASAVNEAKKSRNTDVSQAAGAVSRIMAEKQTQKNYL